MKNLLAFLLKRGRGKKNKLLLHNTKVKADIILTYKDDTIQLKKLSTKGINSDVMIPINPIASPLIAPSTAPNSIALAVPKP